LAFARERGKRDANHDKERFM